ncbi:hypothetical protein CEE35_02835 [Candidatus Aerophobetes bacterium Ae_b3b]|nr:MAG: hypothetical protein CEE35_02835 [Candidatus Aerophobetes bacterium Ae_b3b]
MTSKERILGAIKGQEIDRVPIYAPFLTARVINPAHVPVVPPISNLLQDGISALDDWLTKDPNYLQITKLVNEKCEKVWSYYFRELDRWFLLTPREFIKVAKVEEENDSILIKYQVRTPKGNLEYICEKRKDISTVWDRKYIIKDKKDVERILSVPYTLQKSDIEDFFKYRREIEEKGGLMYIFVSIPMVCVSQLFPFEQFLTWCATERSTLVRLIETAFERIFEQLEYLLQNGVGPIFHFGGSEQATPPMMSPELYDEFVLKYDSRFFDLVHRYGSYVAVHCHGRVGSILDKLIDMGVDLLDPVEAPPGGDIEIGEAKRKVKGRITLVGNIQISDMENCTPEEIDEKVKEAIFSGGKEKFILGTTEGPLSSVSDRMKENYIRFVEAGIKYGRFN